MKPQIKKKYPAGWHGSCFVVLCSLKRPDQPKRTPTVSFYCRWPCYEKQKIPKIHQHVRNICINRRKKKPTSVHIKFQNHYKTVTAVGKKTPMGNSINDYHTQNSKSPQNCNYRWKKTPMGNTINDYHAPKVES